MAADGYLTFFLSCPAVLLSLPFPTAPFDGDSRQCSSKNRSSLAAWLGPACCVLPWALKALGISLLRTNKLSVGSLFWVTA